MAFDYCRPEMWPLRWRRAFLLTLPLSGPLWIASLVVGGTVTLVLYIVMRPIILLKERLWDERQEDGWPSLTTALKRQK